MMVLRERRASTYRYDNHLDLRLSIEFREKATRLLHTIHIAVSCPLFVIHTYGVLINDIL